MQASWAEKALLLQHGIIRIASAPLTEQTGATTGFVDVTGDQQTEAAADMRSSAALDLMLRLFQLWVAAEKLPCVPSAIGNSQVSRCTQPLGSHPAFSSETPAPF